MAFRLMTLSQSRHSTFDGPLSYYQCGLLGIFLYLCLGACGHAFLLSIPGAELVLGCMLMFSFGGWCQGVRTFLKLGRVFEIKTRHFT